MHERIFERWLPGAILNGKLRIPFRKLETKYQARKWQPRGWPGIDPKKESDSNRQNIQAGLDSRTHILAQQGRDIEDVFQEILQETTRATDLGIDIAQLDQAMQVQEVPDDET